MVVLEIVIHILEELWDMSHGFNDCVNSPAKIYLGRSLISHSFSFALGSYFTFNCHH
jgi:hypothetical protein